MQKLELNSIPYQPNSHLETELPFEENQGLLEFKSGLPSPEFLTHWSFEMHLYGEPVWIDHFVITFPDRKTLEDYATPFFQLGAKAVEGPDLFPIKFCAENISVPTDLWIHLMTLLMPSGGLVVLDAPHAPGDQKDRFQQERGLEAVHHVALRVDNAIEAAQKWRSKGFIPLSQHPLNYGSLTQWFLQNSAGQIIELIERHPGNHATFDCHNIAGLRLSELRQSRSHTSVIEWGEITTLQ